LEFTRVTLCRLSKPLSIAISNYTKSHPKMRKFCIRTGNFMNYYYVRFTHYDSIMINESARFTIKTLKDKQAADLGAEVIAECLLTAIPITFVVLALKHKYDDDEKLEIMQENIRSLNVKYDDIFETLNSIQLEMTHLIQSKVVETAEDETTDNTSHEIEKAPLTIAKIEHESQNMPNVSAKIDTQSTVCLTDSNSALIVSNLNAQPQ